MLKLLVALAVVVALSISGAANAALVTFEGSTTTGANRVLDVDGANAHGPSLIDYEGYNWSGMVVAKPLVSVGNPQMITSKVYNSVDQEWEYTTAPVAAGFHRSMVSGDTVAFTQSFSGSSSLFASMSARPGDVNFNYYSTYMTAGWRDNINVNVKGLRDGQTVYNQNLVIGDDGPTLMTLNFLNIDEIQFLTSGGAFLYPNGTNVGDFLNSSNAFSTPVLVFDNMSVAPVPIPAAAWLLGTGIVGLAALRRKVQK